MITIKKEIKAAVFLDSLYLVRPSEGRMMTMKISSKKHLCIVT